MKVLFPKWERRASMTDLSQSEIGLLAFIKEDDNETQNLLSSCTNHPNPILIWWIW